MAAYYNEFRNWRLVSLSQVVMTSMSETMKRLKCLIGIHDWKHLDTFHINGKSVKGRHITINYMSRTIHVYECKVCGRRAEYTHKTK